MIFPSQILLSTPIQSPQFYQIPLLQILQQLIFKMIKTTWLVHKIFLDLAITLSHIPSLGLHMISCLCTHLEPISIKIQFKGIPGGLSGSAPAFGPGCDPGVPRSSPTSGSLHGACFSLCLCLCLSLSLFHEQINKITKNYLKRKPAAPLCPPFDALILCIVFPLRKDHPINTSPPSQWPYTHTHRYLQRRAPTWAPPRGDKTEGFSGKWPRGNC